MLILLLERLEKSGAPNSQWRYKNLFEQTENLTSDQYLIIANVRR